MLEIGITWFVQNVSCLAVCRFYYESV